MRRIIPGLIFISCISLFLFTACNKESEKTQKVKVVELESPSEKKYFSGAPDIPVGEKQATSSGFGKLILGDSIEKICKYYDCSKVLTFSIWESGKEWPAKKILLANNKYIVAGMVNTVDKVTLLATNDPGFLTRTGLHAGMPLDSIATLQDSIFINDEHKSFSFDKSGVWIKTDENTEAKYFKSKNINSLKGGFIKEIYIVCGDC